MSRLGTTVGPRDETTPSAQTIGYELETSTISSETFALAIETLENGMQVLVVGNDWPTVETWAWRLVEVQAMTAPGSETRH